MAQVCQFIANFIQINII